MEGEPRTSPPFSYGGREWCLRFNYSTDHGLYHSIWLHRLDGADGKIEEKFELLTDVFDVQPFMLHWKKRDKVVEGVWDRNVCAASRCLWWSGEDSEAIFRRLDWLRDRPEVKFACRFPAPPTIPTDKDKLIKEVKSLKDEIKILQNKVQQQGLESENYEKKIIALQNENLSIADGYKGQFEEKITFISELEKDKDELVEEVESLKTEIKTLQKTVQQQGLESENYEKKIIDLQKENLSIADELEEKMTFISRLEKACLDHELHKKEMESLLNQMKTLQTTVENNRTPPEIGSKPTSPAGIEPISDGERTSEHQDESTIASGLEIAAFGGDAVEENNMVGEKGESGNGKKVKQQSRVKSTPKISLPARHDDVICSLKSVLASGSRSDFTLKSGGGEGWTVHRAVLEGRSGPLDAMLRGTGDELRLDDVTGDAIEGLVRFLYSGEVGRSGNVNEILAAAHELNLGDLESLCLEEWMGPALVCTALVAARALKGGGDLEARALDCYFRDPGRVHVTEGWKDLKESHPGIVAGLFQEFVKRFGKDNRAGLCAEMESTSSS